MTITELFEGVKDPLSSLKDYITKKYKESDVDEMVDAQVMEYIDADWEDDGEYDNEQEWYDDFGHGEAEDDIINQLTKEAMNYTKTKLNFNERIKFDEWLQDKYWSLEH